MMDAILLLRKMQATNNLSIQSGREAVLLQPPKGAAIGKATFKAYTNPFSGKIELLTPLNDEIL